MCVAVAVVESQVLPRRSRWRRADDTPYASYGLEGQPCFTAIPEDETEWGNSALRVTIL